MSRQQSGEEPTRYDGRDVALPAYSKRQQELIAARGTPEEFEAAVGQAVDDLLLTPAEAAASVQQYRNEFHAAG